MEPITKKINVSQEKSYKQAELNQIEKYLERYGRTISEMNTKSKIKILDVGGGAGYFIKELLKQLKKGIDIEIYLLDTTRYDTWNEMTPNIHFVEGDALNIGKLFEEKTFDYIFCNMVFHHLIGDSFKMSAKIRKKCLEEMKKVLKDDGKINIIDNYNNGYGWDEISCRIIYTFTTIRNPLAVKICQFGGAESAGVGVCMLSKKMWFKLIKNASLHILYEIESEPSGLGILRKIGLLNKEYREHNLMVLVK